MDLVRLPAVLSVPGDSLLGAACAAVPQHPARTMGLAASSCLLYLGGMALNDYADRDVDAVERPHRPVPSGRVSPEFALRLGQGLLAAGVVTAGVWGGRRGLAVAVPLATTIWAYDLELKDTPGGPVAMAACRSLDVLLGAARAGASAAFPAAVVGAHTLTVTLVSRHEAQGATGAVGQRAARA
ncbi:MAG: 4-hydroxybenzoate polyprenyltransferase, partial [Actinobacteria bacterium]